MLWYGSEAIEVVVLQGQSIYLQSKTNGLFSTKFDNGSFIGQFGVKLNKEDIANIDAILFHEL